MPTDHITHVDTPTAARKYRPKIDYALTGDGFLFRSNRHRCLYYGKTRKEKPQWLKENAGNYWRIDELEIEPARLDQPDRRQSVASAPAQSTLEPASSHVHRGSDNADVAAAARPGASCAAQSRPTLPPTRAKPGAPVQPKPQPYIEPAVNDIEPPKVVASPVEATVCNQEYSGTCRCENQQAPGRRRKTRSKAAQRLLAERMLIVIEALTERPIYRDAAEKAGVHRKTLEYWLKCSRAGNEDYEIEWQDYTLPFHEHCATAIDIAHDKILESAWEFAMGVKSKQDEDGNWFEEVVGRHNGKMMRFLMELVRPEKWGKNPTIDRPQTGGVLVLGGPTEQPQTCPAASIKARQWKSRLKTVTEAGRSSL